MKKFLLHTCCAPCSVAVIDELKDQFDLTVFFYNPNIHPVEEYEKRKKEVIRVCKKWQVKMIDADYEIDKWHEAVVGLEDQPESGSRCLICFKLRLKRTVKYAEDNGFDIFGTTLTSGRNKSAQIIHPLALELSQKTGLKFWQEDWKKGGRQEKGRKLTEDLNIYRQDYCGCMYSKSDRDVDKK